MVLFWSSDILTGNQTTVHLCFSCDPFWSSDILTGNQTARFTRDDPD